jgi:hypothetical protein
MELAQQAASAIKEILHQRCNDEQQGKDQQYSYNTHGGVLRVMRIADL